MLNLPETIITKKTYSPQRDVFIRATIYTSGAIVLVKMLRAQVCEIDLLQLVPGFYLLLMFIGYIVMIFSSQSLYELPQAVDCYLAAGTKTEVRMSFAMISKFAIVLFSLVLCMSLANLIPLSLDMFETSSDQNLIDLWSFEEVLNVEWILLLIVLTVTQAPTFIIFYLTNETDSLILPGFWQKFSFLVFVGAGMITPTVDGYTQLYFAFTGIALYLTMLNMVEKRMTYKFLGNLSVSF